MVNDKNGLDNWNQWSKHVLLTAERQEESINRLIKEVGELRGELAGLKAVCITNDKYMKLRDDIVSLKTKAGIWGGSIGFLASAIVALLLKLT